VIHGPRGAAQVTGTVALRRRLAAFELAVERARFEADRARRQFDAVEPENRLVGRNLERAWETHLAELRRTESELATQRVRRPSALSADELAWVSAAGADVRREGRALRQGRVRCGKCGRMMQVSYSGVGSGSTRRPNQ